MVRWAVASLRRHFAIDTFVLLAMPSQGRDGPPSDHSFRALHGFLDAFRLLHYG